MNELKEVTGQQCPLQQVPLHGNGTSMTLLTLPFNLYYYFVLNEMPLGVKSGHMPPCYSGGSDHT